MPRRDMRAIFTSIGERLRADRSAATAIEYALIAALISIVLVVAAAGILEVAFGKWAKDVQKAIVKTCCD